jgi:uncharacterized membrane protein YbhN (UPF0104 family)
VNPPLMPPALAELIRTLWTITFLLVVVVIIFIILRGFFLWYWKINTILKNQEKTNLMIKKYIEAKGFEFTDDEKARLKS